MSKVFTHDQDILFQHCDPAGIVFYPRFFEMINLTIERWFDKAIGYSFAQMHVADQTAVPTASVEATFNAPGKLGEEWQWHLTVERVGRTSVKVRVWGTHDAQTKVESTMTLVHITKSTGRPIEWSSELKDKMTLYLEKE